MRLFGPDSEPEPDHERVLLASPVQQLLFFYLNTTINSQTQLFTLALPQEQSGIVCMYSPM